MHLLPLGGTGEIGMNLNLYHHAGRWLMVDCGVMFEREGPHTQYVVMPDPSFIVQRAAALDGLVLTHAHLDHIGAVADLWPRLRCRIYATPFCAAMLRSSLQDAEIADQVPIHLLTERAEVRIGPFDLQRIGLSHSTVEMGALVIRTPAGTVLHTGDWKLDADPIVGTGFDAGALQALRDVDAVISDSTNADREGWTPSEGSLTEPLREILASRPNRVAVTCFASNVARIRTLVEAGVATGRHPVLFGRSLQRSVSAAHASGYLTDLPDFVPSRDYGYLPRSGVLLICTGSQGEVRAGLSRLAADQRDDLYLEAGDAVVFSARQIPGNELAIARLLQLFEERSIEVITADQAHVHVSGHPRREELRTLYRWVAPRSVVPVHGTPPKLEAHASLAESEGLIGCRIRNGQVLQLAPGPPRIVDEIPTGRIRIRS